LSDREITALGRAGQAKRGVVAGPKAGSQGDAIEVVFDTVAYTPGGMGGPNADLVWDGLLGMALATVQIGFGASITQLDSPVPGLMDLIGIAVMVEGLGDLVLNYGRVVDGLLGTERSLIPDDFGDAAVDAITGDDRAGDLVEEMIDFVWTEGPR